MKIQVGPLPPIISKENIRALLLLFSQPLCGIPARWISSEEKYEMI
jgi:hypothetical protein